MDYKNLIGVVGYREAVIPYIAIGAKAVITESIEEVKKTIELFAREGCPVILVPDDILKIIPEIYDKYSTMNTPVITSIPGKDGTSGFTEEKINALIKKAIGIDLEAIGGENHGNNN